MNCFVYVLGKKKALIVFSLVMQSTAKVFLPVVHQNCLQTYLGQKSDSQHLSACGRCWWTCAGPTLARDRQALCHSKVREGTKRSAWAHADFPKAPGPEDPPRFRLAQFKHVKLCPAAPPFQAAAGYGEGCLIWGWTAPTVAYPIYSFSQDRKLWRVFF